MTRKEELQQRVEAADAARAELWRIEAQETEERNRALIGKCFKYRNCYSCPQGEEDYWWMYAKVTGADGANIRMWQFQTDKDGKVEIGPDVLRGQMAVGYQVILQAEFDEAWAAIMERLKKL